jgi:hypothetical protein
MLLLLASRPNPFEAFAKTAPEHLDVEAKGFDFKFKSPRHSGVEGYIRRPSTDCKFAIIGEPTKITGYCIIFWGLR